MNRIMVEMTLLWRWLLLGRKPQPRPASLLAALLFVAIFSRMAGFFNPIIDEDEAWYHTFGGLLLDGGWPYTAAVDLDFAGGEIALQVVHVVVGIPQTPFNHRKELEGLRYIRRVFERDLMHFGPGA